MPATIAVIDDEPAIREAVEDLLRSAGYHPLLFACAEDFLVFPGRGAVDAMIVDVRMPGLSGLELQAILRREGSGCPTIFLTSRDDEPTRHKALEDGARCVLGKPVDAEILMRWLGRVLDR
jgi:FixJ family two-component response regulator